jgi:hypothetical protein
VSSSRKFRRRPLFARSPYLFLLLSTAIRLAAGLIALKYLAWQFGPSTFGLLTQVMGIAAIFYLFAGGGVTNGVIRNVSASPSEDERRRWMSAATTITVHASVILAVVAIALALFGSSVIFGEPGYALVFVGIAASQILVGFERSGWSTACPWTAKSWSSAARLPRGAASSRCWRSPRWPRMRGLTRRVQGGKLDAGLDPRYSPARSRSWSLESPLSRLDLDHSFPLSRNHNVNPYETYFLSRRTGSQARRIMPR